MITSLDTNVIVRLVTADDPDQTRHAKDLVTAGPVFVTKTVLLETEWVLRVAYNLERDVLAGSLRAFLGLPQVSVEDETKVAQALAAYAAGMDFADALHLTSSPAGSRFASFDRDLRRRAVRRRGLPPVIEP